MSSPLTRLVLLAVVTIGVATVAPARARAQAPPQPVFDALDRIARLDVFTVFDWISARYDRGTLTLSGFASRPALVEQALAAARATRGVDEVASEIELLPALQDDDAVRVRAYVAIYGHPGLERYGPGGGLSGLDVREIERAWRSGLEASRQFQGRHPIHIIVSGASIQLLGTVSSTGDRQIAEVQVRTLRGVLNVVNRLEVSR